MESQDYHHHTFFSLHQNSFRSPLIGQMVSKATQLFRNKSVILFSSLGLFFLAIILTPLP